MISELSFEEFVRLPSIGSDSENKSISQYYKLLISGFRMIEPRGEWAISRDYKRLPETRK